MARRLSNPSIRTFIMEHGLDHALIDELGASRIEDPVLAKLWAKAHLQVTGILHYLEMEEEYNL
jgi:hypothetical protein